MQKAAFCRSFARRARQPLAAIIAEMFGCLGLGGLPYKSQENGSRQGRKRGRQQQKEKGRKPREIR